MILTTNVIVAQIEIRIPTCFAACVPYNDDNDDVNNINDMVI